MKYQDQRISRHPLVLIVLYLFFFIGLPGSVSSTLAGPPADLSDGIGVFGKYKSIAENQADLLVRLEADNEITKDDYRKGQSLYAQAKAEFDGLIDQLVFEIEFGAKATLPSISEAILEKAIEKGDEFLNFVDEQAHGTEDMTRGFGSKTIRCIFDLIVAAITNGSSTEQLDLIKKLEEYKWLKFHAIEKSNNSSVSE
jgi:hypothetical protein